MVVNTRVNSARSSAPRLGELYRIERPRPRPRKPGLKLSPRGPTPRRQEPSGAPTGERIEADKSRKLRTLVCGDARRIARCGGFRNTFAGVPLPFFFVIVRPFVIAEGAASDEAIPGLNKEWDCFAELEPIGPATSGGTVGSRNERRRIPRGCNMRRENDDACSSSARCGDNFQRRHCEELDSERKQSILQRL